MATNKTANTQDTAVQTVKAAEPTASERFMNLVFTELGRYGEHDMRLSDYQKSLAKGYLNGIDRMLKTTEDKRIKRNAANKDHKYDNNIPYIWDNVNMEELAVDVAHYARMGLDILLPNQISAVPYGNSKTKKYDINLSQGYNGIKLIAEKYAADPQPTTVTIELRFAKDKFKEIKRDMNHPVAGYTFEVDDPFDRGEVVGGFGYIEYENPAKNKLIVMNMEDIRKRIPAKAATEFWGGTKKEWIDNKQVETTIPGWFKEMCYKTIVREVYGGKHILIDSSKIDDDYRYIESRVGEMALIEAQSEIDANANTVLLEPTDGVTVDVGTGEVLPSPSAGNPTPPASTTSKADEEPF